MGDREEGLLNEFEEAYQRQDYARLAEMIRFIRSEVRRDPGLADRVPTRELFELLDTEDETLAEEIRWLLRDLLERVDVASILSTFGQALEAALRPGSRKEVLHLGLDFMAKAAAPVGEGGKNGLSTAQWRALVQLLAHEDVSIADRVTDIISSSSGELRDYFSREIGNIECNKGTGMNDTVRVRFLALRVRMKVSDGGWEEVKQLLKEAAEANDPLLMMNALQIVQEGCSDVSAMEECYATGVVLRVSELAKTGSLECFLRVKAVVTLASVFRTISPVIPAALDNAKPLEVIDQFLETDDRPLLAAALLLFGVLCTNEAIPESALQALSGRSTLYQLMLDSSLQVQEAFHATIATVFEATPRRLQSVFYRQLSTAIATHPIALLVERASSTLSESFKSSAYDALEALLRHDWIVEDAVVTTSLINFLLNRSSDRSMLGLQRKYDLVRHLSNMPVIGDPVKGQLRAYLSQGVAYSRVAPALATQNR